MRVASRVLCELGLSKQRSSLWWWNVKPKVQRWVADLGSGSTADWRGDEGPALPGPEHEAPGRVSPDHWGVQWCIAHQTSLTVVHPAFGAYTMTLGTHAVAAWKAEQDGCYNLCVVLFQIAESPTLSLQHWVLIPDYFENKHSWFSVQAARRTLHHVIASFLGRGWVPVGQRGSPGLRGGQGTTKTQLNPVATDNRTIRPARS